MKENLLTCDSLSGNIELYFVRTKKITVILFTATVLSILSLSCTKGVDGFEECDCPVQDPGTGDPMPNQQDPNIQYLTFRGLRLSDPGGGLPIENPERGFRFEFIMNSENLLNPYHGTNYANNFSATLNNEDIAYGNNKLKIAQVYFYLSSFIGGSISASAFNNMQSILDQFNSNGIKVLLRFAYRYNESIPKESLADIFNHMTQLESFLDQNKEKIYVVQAGFLGLWGEWHNSGYDNSIGAKSAVIRRLLEVVPSSLKLQVRETRFKTEAKPAFNGYISNYSPSGGMTVTFPTMSNASADRIGFHNDYFVLDQGPNAQWDYRWPDADFFQARDEGWYTTIDGEMPYDGPGSGTFNTIAYGLEGGWYAARRMRAHHYSTFSIVHNYNTNIAAWKSHMLTPQKFRSDGTLVTDDYFLSSNGAEISRSAFDYIRDHIGYRFQLRTAEIPHVVSTTASATIKARIKNFGFSKLVNYHPIYITLIDQNNVVHEFLNGLSADQIIPTYGQTNGEYELSQAINFNGLTPGIYKVGIWIPDSSPEIRYNPKFSIRLANANMPWWTDPQNQYLINVIGSLTVQ